MKKIVVILVSVMLCVGLVACESSDHTGQAKTPSGSSVQKGRNYEEVKADFESSGFTNIKLEKIEDIITGWLTDDGEVEEVLVGGDSDYSADTWVDAGTEVIIKYHTFKEVTEEKKNDSTEDNTEKEETSTEEITEESSEDSGDEDILAYVKRGQEYNVYYVIDLKNKTAKYGTSYDEKASEGVFTEGDNLNDGIDITFYAGTESEYTERVHWHYENQDSVLILIDANGFDWEFEKTSISLLPDCFK